MFKKIAILMMVFIMAFSMAACGGETPADEPGAEDNAADYEEAYGSVLELAYDIIMLQGEDYEFQDGTMGIWETTNWMDTRKDALKSIGYVFEDISGDDVAELIICSTYAPFEEESDQGHAILAVYTLAADEPVLVLEGSARNAYCLTGDGKVYNYGSAGAAYSIFATYTLSEDGQILNPVDYYFTYDDKYFHNTTGEWGEEGMDEEITSDDYYAKQDEIVSDLVTFTLKDFLTYANEKGLPTAAEGDNFSIRADWASDVLSGMNSDYYEYVSEDTDGVQVVFRVKDDSTVYDFTLLSLELLDVDSDGNPKFNITEVYMLDELTYERPLLAELSFLGDIPNNGIKYTDEAGETHYLTIGESGYDGSLILTPFKF